MRQKINDELKKAMFAKNDLRVQTLRMVNAAIKDKDINARTADKRDGIGDDEIVKIMQSMVKQRRDSAAVYQQGNRQELADKELAEIAIISEFMPQMFSEAELNGILTGIISHLNASSIKDMGNIMAQLRANHAGKYDPALAAVVVKKIMGI